MGKKTVLINKTTRETKTFDFSTYGNNIPSVRAAVNEIVWNALGYGKNISIKTTGGYLTICNDGVPANINELFMYGNSYSRSQYSYYGSGMTQATAFFNPSNNDFEVATQCENGIHVIQSPFATEMTVGTAEKWNYPEWAKTAYCVRDENGVLADYTIKDAGISFALAIENGFKITFNGKVVKPIRPDDGKNVISKETTTTYKMEKGKFAIRHIEITLPRDGAGTEEFPRSETAEGIHLYYNGCYIGWFGVGILDRATKTGRLKLHQSMNRYRDIIDIQTEGLENPMRIPFNNMKTEIKWSTKEGQILRSVIDELCGTRYRTKHDSYTEAFKRAAIDYIAEKLYGRTRDLRYKIQAKVGVDAQADAIVYRGEGEYDYAKVLRGEQSIEIIIEFKPHAIAWTHCSQAIGYALLAEEANQKSENPYTPTILLIGDNTKKGYDDIIASAARHCFDVDFAKYCKEEIERRMKEMPEYAID